MSMAFVQSTIVASKLQISTITCSSHKIDQQCTTTNLGFFKRDGTAVSGSSAMLPRLLRKARKTHDNDAVHNGGCSKTIRMARPYAGRRLLRMPQQIDNWISQNQHQQDVVRVFRERLANHPTAFWMGDWTPNIYNQAKDIVDRARRSNSLYQVVLYNIPLRDGGNYSGGGAKSEGDYQRWIDGAAEGLRGAKGIVILEPDALAQLDGLRQQGEKDARLRMLKYAARKLESVGAEVYVDAGHPRWHNSRVMTDRLKAGGVWDATGFALNISNSIWSRECGNYGMDISRRLGGGKGYIIDTSRNGAGPPNASGEGLWCNPSSLRTGFSPETNPQAQFGSNCHALLWIKTPGESDGYCNGGPRAGDFWPEGAKRLAGFYG